MIDDSGAILDQFLIYVDLAECRPKLEQIGVHRFDNLDTVTKKALELVLPNPAVNRILANVGKFANHYPKKKKYPPLTDFLEKLQLTDIQKELEDKLKISRVEHLRYTTVEDLQIVVGREDAKRILKSYKKFKNSVSDLTWELILMFNSAIKLLVFILKISR
ncbi:unnamed protein product [Hymenolepis diminuta]|uniref:non-specific protein-tyrosine kinase n=1 Tax=Hymenolepis diminuta TaxID=6216 RepID=A0A0R3SMG4_HYMDI|nr:unnamed protein product [Hymenolepis diminuta]